MQETRASEDRATANTGTHDEFYQYYARESTSPETVARFEAQKKALLTFSGKADSEPLLVADIGCGPGASSAIWARPGHLVVGIDINSALVELAASRAKEAKIPPRFLVGSADHLPLRDGTFDVCLAPELLEHVPDWRSCLSEIARVLKPGGVAYLSTTNTLCPQQHEFNLPLYSWYPARLKRHFETLAMTSRPDLANYATYPAVNWFNFYTLRSVLRGYGFDRFWDRFDMAAQNAPEGRKHQMLKVIRSNRLGRLAGYVITGGTQIIARKAV
jgi:ubiquinone/menaquinone biosynthesis C-methylase UbiE